MRHTSVTAGFVDSTTIQLRFELGLVIDAVQQASIPEGLAAPNAEGWIWDNDLQRNVGKVLLDGVGFMPMDVYKPSVLEDLFAAPFAETNRAPAAVDDLSRWTVEVNGVEVSLDALSRKAHLRETAEVGLPLPEFSTTQNVFLELATPLAEGDTLRIRFDDSDFETIRVTYDPDTVISEAIHVNLTGYDPDDGSKVATLSSWNGWDATAGAEVAQVFEGRLPFRLVDEATGETVFEGRTTLAAGVEEPTNYDRGNGVFNYARTDIWAADFSDFAGTGSFHVVVEGVGRSQSFDIAEDHWSGIFQHSFQGFYHQRSGIALEEPWTDWTRDRSLHPDDGIVSVRATDIGIQYVTEGYNTSFLEKFEAILANATDEVVPDAWGGWHDAGDWDRRTVHMEAARQLIDLTEIVPDWAAEAEGSIPESLNDIPDLLDEAIWGLDVFRRMQTEDGGIRGGIEGDRYRDYGAASWNEPTPLFAYAPDIYSSWEFAASAAKLSRALAPYDPAQAAVWAESARDAMRWGEANQDTHIADYGPLDAQLVTSRNLAALEMYILTGKDRWHDLFLDTASYADPDATPNWDEWQYEAAYTYARLAPALTDAAVAKRAYDVIMGEAEFLLSEAKRSGFGYTFNPYAPYVFSESGQVPESGAHHYIRAHVLSGEARFLNAAMDDLAYGLGANAYNMAFLTGLAGIRTPEDILVADAEALGRDPPPGIMLYGDHSIFDGGYQWYHTNMRDKVWPDFYQLPINESHQGYFGYVPSTEFTVMRNVSDVTYIAGYLAGVNGDSAARQLREGTGGADRIRGEGGEDRIEGGAGRDMLAGRGNSDMLLGEDGRDRLFGNGGSDLIFGGAGRDLINGGRGSDDLIGGRGADVFVFGAKGGRDAIHGFDASEDILRLRADLVDGARSGAGVIREFGDWSEGGRLLTLDFGEGAVLRVISEDRIRPMMAEAIEIV